MSHLSKLPGWFFFLWKQRYVFMVMWYVLLSSVFLLQVGTYFNFIMGMVASSVVLTVIVLNYHHRYKDSQRNDNNRIKLWFTHWRPFMISYNRLQEHIFTTIYFTFVLLLNKYFPQDTRNPRHANMGKYFDFIWFWPAELFSTN